MKIDKSVVEVLKTSEIDGSLLRLPGQLERKLYERVSKVLKAIGGKWSSAKKAFVFKEDVGDLVTSIADSGEFVPDRQTFQFFPTPEALAREIVEIAGIREFQFHKGTIKTHCLGICNILIFNRICECKVNKSY